MEKNGSLDYEPARACRYLSWAQVGAGCIERVEDGSPDERICVMRTYKRQSGSVMVMTVFVIALLSTIVMGILEMNTVDIQIMQNQVSAGEAKMMALAGLNHALDELRADAGWNDGFTNQAWNGGSYTVDVSGTTLTSTGKTAAGFSSEVTAEITLSASGPPYIIRLDEMRTNQ